MTDVIKESLKNLVKKYLTCSICYSVILPPVIEVCQFRHNVCYACEYMLEECPICQSPAAKKRNLDIENIVRTLDMTFPCKYNKFGCSAVGLYQNLPAHTSVCIFAYVQCPLRHDSRPCSWSGYFPLLTYHIMEVHCDYFLVYQESDNVGFTGNCIDCKVIIFKEQEFFILETYIDHVSINNHFCLNVSYFGPKENQPEFKYELQLGADFHKPKKYPFISSSRRGVYDFQLHVSYYELRNYCNPYNSISEVKYCLNIKKLDHYN